MYAVCTAPASGHVLTLGQLRAHVGLEPDETDHDDILTALIGTVEAACIAQTGRALLTETWQMTTDAPDALNRIVVTGGVRPVVTRLDVLRSGSYVQLVENIDWVQRPHNADQTLLRPKSPQAGGSGSFGPYDQDEAAFKIAYTRGYGASASSVPPPLVAAMLLEAGDLFSNRDGSITANLVRNPAVASLISPYRASLV